MNLSDAVDLPAHRLAADSLTRYAAGHGLDATESEDYARAVVGRLAATGKPFIFHKSGNPYQPGDEEDETAGLSIPDPLVIQELNRRLGAKYGPEALGPVARASTDRERAFDEQVEENKAPWVDARFGGLVLKSDPRAALFVNTVGERVGSELMKFGGNVAGIPELLATGKLGDPTGLSARGDEHARALAVAQQEMGGQSFGAKLSAELMQAPAFVGKVQLLQKAVRSAPVAMALLSAAENLDRGGKPAVIAGVRSFLIGRSMGVTNQFDPVTDASIQSAVGFINAKLGGASTEDALVAAGAQGGLSMMFRPAGSMRAEAKQPAPESLTRPGVSRDTSLSARTDAVVDAAFARGSGASAVRVSKGARPTELAPSELPERFEVRVRSLDDGTETNVLFDTVTGDAVDLSTGEVLIEAKPAAVAAPRSKPAEPESRAPLEDTPAAEVRKPAADDIWMERPEEFAEAKRFRVESRERQKPFEALDAKAREARARLDAPEAPAPVVSETPTPSPEVAELNRVRSALRGHAFEGSSVKVLSAADFKLISESEVAREVFESYRQKTLAEGRGSLPYDYIGRLEVDRMPIFEALSVLEGRVGQLTQAARERAAVEPAPAAGVEPQPLAAPARVGSPEVIRHSADGGRDVVVVELPSGARQAFYRSTGINSGRPGEWLPFDGVAEGGRLHGWFDKGRYEVAGPLHRFGSEENRAVSEWLGAQDIPAGRAAEASEINNALRSLGALGEDTDAYARAMAAPHAPAELPDLSEFAENVRGGSAAAPPRPAPRVDLSTGEVLEEAAPVTHVSGVPVAEVVATRPETVKALPRLIETAEARAAEFEARAADASLPGWARAEAAEQAAQAWDSVEYMRSARRAFESVGAKYGDAPGVPSAEFPSAVVTPAPAHPAALPDLSGFAETSPVSSLPARLENALPERLRRFGEEVDARRPRFVASGDGRPYTRADAAAQFTYAADLISLPKALKASYDISGPGRQGWPIGLAHPTFFKRAYSQGAKALASDDAFKAFAESVRARPDYLVMRERAGIYLPSVDDLESGGDLSRLMREENYSSRLGDSVPGVRASNRGYMASLDAMRVALWDVLSPDIARSKHATNRTYRAVGELINLSAGRGLVPILDRSAAGRKVVAALNVPFFSPRVMASRFNLISPLRFGRNLAARDTRVVAYMQAREGMRALATISAVAGALSQVPGVEVGWNPRRSGFGKVRIGKTVYDLTGGMGHTVRYLAQLAQSFADAERGESKEGKGPAGLTARYLRSQLSPSGAVTTDYATGERFEGDPFDASRVPADLTVPFVVEGAYEGWTEGGGSSLSDVRAGKPFETGFVGAGMTAPSVGGVAVKSYESRGRQADLVKHGEARDFAPVDSPGLRELGRLGVAVKRVGKGYGLEGVTGDKLGFGDDQLVMPKEARGELERELLAEIARASDEMAGDPAYSSFPSDSERKTYAEKVVNAARARVLNGFRLRTRTKQVDKLDELNQKREELERRGESQPLSSPLKTEGRRVSTNIEDRRGTSPEEWAEIQSAGRPRISGAQADVVAMTLDGMDERRFSNFAERLDETRSLPRPVADAAAGVVEFGADKLGSREVATAARLLRQLAREQSTQPLQFWRNVEAGRYGETLKAEFAGGNPYPQNVFPWEK